MLRTFWRRHPTLVTWLLLSVGMVLLTVYFARDAGLQSRHAVILSAVSVLLAAACTWILSWERE